MFKTSILLGLSACLFLSSCGKLQPLTEAEQTTRHITREVKRNETGLSALIAVADATPYDGFAWRRGERLQIRQRNNDDLQLLEQAEAPEIIATAVKHNVPSFSIVRYQQGWLVVFDTYLSEHCQAVYAYAYRGQLPGVAQCDAERFASQANGQCQQNINADWQVFKEWFFAESLVAEGNPVCKSKVAAGWHTEPRL